MSEGWEDSKPSHQALMLWQLIQALGRVFSDLLKALGGAAQCGDLAAGLAAVQRHIVELAGSVKERRVGGKNIHRLPILVANNQVAIGGVVFATSRGVGQHAYGRGLMPVARKKRGVNGFIGFGRQHTLFMMQVSIGLVRG